MKALFVAYQDEASRRWAPVARLTREEGRYHFVYTHGAKAIAHFTPFGRMTNLAGEYVSEKLFPLFANRILPKSRPEYRDYMHWLGLSEEKRDEIEELARTGGVRATDSLELIPCPEPTEDGRYELFFFSRGLRHLPEESRGRVESLREGERLFLLEDRQNAQDGMALMLRTDTPSTLVGYLPRYYAADCQRLLTMLGPDAVEVSVEQINHEAPIQYRLLCRLSAPWPDGFEPCASGEFEALSDR